MGWRSVNEASKKGLVQKGRVLTSVTAQICRPPVFPAHFSIRVCHRGIFRGAFFAGANFLAAFAFVPHEVRALLRAGVSDGFVSNRAVFGVAGYRP